MDRGGKDHQEYLQVRRLRPCRRFGQVEGLVRPIFYGVGFPVTGVPGGRGEDAPRIGEDKTVFHAQHSSPGKPGQGQGAFPLRIVFDLFCGANIRGGIRPA